MDAERVAGGRHRLRGGIEGGSELEGAALALSLGADPLPILTEPDPATRTVLREALDQAAEIAGLRLTYAVNRGVYPQKKGR